MGCLLGESGIWIIRSFDSHEKVSIIRDHFNHRYIDQEMELEMIYRGNNRFSKRNDRIRMKEMMGWVSNSSGDKVGRSVNDHCARSRGNRNCNCCSS